MQSHWRQVAVLKLYSTILQTALVLMVTKDDLSLVCDIISGTEAWMRDDETTPVNREKYDGY